MDNNELLKRIVALEKKVNYPIDFNFQKTLEKAFFDELHINILKGGLPVYTGARTDTPKQGEIWILDNGVNFQLKYYSNGATHSIVAI